MSPHLEADGLVQDELPPTPLNFDRFHQPCLLPGRTPGKVRTVRPRTTWRPLTLSGSLVFSPCVSLKVLTTPTGRFHGKTLVRPSLPCVCHSVREKKGSRTQAGSRPSRVRRRLFGARLGTPSPWRSTVFSLSLICPLIRLKKLQSL